MNQFDKDQTDKKGFWKNYAIFQASWSWRVWLIGAIFLALETIACFNKHNYFEGALGMVVTILWFYVSWKKAKI